MLIIFKMITALNQYLFFREFSHTAPPVRYIIITAKSTPTMTLILVVLIPDIVVKYLLIYPMDNIILLPGTRRHKARTE